MTPLEKRFRNEVLEKPVKFRDLHLGDLEFIGIQLVKGVFEFSQYYKFREAGDHELADIGIRIGPKYNLPPVLSFGGPTHIHVISQKDCFEIEFRRYESTRRGLVFIDDDTDFFPIYKNYGELPPIKEI